MQHNPEVPSEVWRMISPNARILAMNFCLAGRGVMTDTDIALMDFLQVRTPNIEGAMRELEEFGLIRKTTILGELHREARRLSHPEEMGLKSLDELPIDKRLRILRESVLANNHLREYDQDPEGHAEWRRSGYRLQEDFYEWVRDLLKPF